MSQPALKIIQGGKAEERRTQIQALYTKYGGSVLGRCRYLLKDAATAEDAMHDVFARALDRYEDFRKEASPLTWLMKIATHHCLNLQRAQRAPWRRIFERAESARPEGHGGPAVLEAKDAVRTVLARFDLETQAAAIHYYVDEMTLQEVADLLGRSVPTIRKRLVAFAEASGQELRP
jgi:RNA polymerase sigma-70 factor (ECF subfamily)